MNKKFLSKFEKKNKNKKINSRLSGYPCEDYLHNALRFISDGKPLVAYDEICNAIIRSGGSLTESEKQTRKGGKDD